MTVGWLSDNMRTPKPKPDAELNEQYSRARRGTIPDSQWQSLQRRAGRDIGGKGTGR